MQPNYPRCLANTLKEEGGWTNDPRDPGGPTMRGVIQREYTKYRMAHGLPTRSVRLIEEDELQAIYRGNYWEPMRGDLWPKGPDQIVFDIAVNSGTGRAPQIMAAAIGTSERSPLRLASLATQSADKAGIVKRACARRASFYRSLRTFSAFGRGWLARNARMEAIGVKMCLEVAAASGGVSIPGVVAPGSLIDERDAAAAAASKNAKAAATTGAGGTAAGGGTATTADPGAWDAWQWLGAGALTLVLVLLLAGFVYAWLRHRERVKAYAAAVRGELETSLGAIVAAARNATERFEEAI